MFLSQYAAVFLSFVLSSGRSKESVLYVRFSSWYHSAFSPESQEHDSVKSQKFLVPCKIFYVRDFFYVMSTNPHQTRSQNLPEYNLSLFYCTFRHSTTPEYTQNPSGNFKQFLILEMNRMYYCKTQYPSPKILRIPYKNPHRIHAHTTDHNSHFSIF